MELVKNKKNLVENNEREIRVMRQLLLSTFVLDLWLQGHICDLKHLHIIYLPWPINVPNMSTFGQNLRE